MGRGGRARPRRTWEQLRSERLPAHTALCPGRPLGSWAEPPQSGQWALSPGFGRVALWGLCENEAALTLVKCIFNRHD